MNNKLPIKIQKDNMLKKFFNYIKKIFNKKTKIKDMNEIEESSILEGRTKINELYLIADIIMTDYSSIFFDYANLKKPIIYYMYDFDDYKKTKNKMIEDYKDKTAWARKMLINTANSGYFSSDRTIEEYNNEIWKLN